MTATVTGDALPVIRDFGRDATDPARYARLNPGWSLAVADIEASTRLVDEGRHRDVNFVAAAVVAAVSAAIRDGGDQLAPVAAQFGGDGAVIAVPPGRHGAVREALGALAGWAKREVGLTLRVGLVGVAELEAAGHDTLAALLDVGSGNSFGLFLGSGPGTAESWLKSGTLRLEPTDGPVPGLETLSCRWEPVRARRGTVLCVIADPTESGAAGAAVTADLLHAIEAIVPTTAAAPLGSGEPLVLGWPPRWRSLWLEARAARAGRRALRVARGLVASAIVALSDRLGLRPMGFDARIYRRDLAARTDFRKAAGGLRFVLDVTEAEAAAIERLLAERQARGQIRSGTARTVAATVTCLVGDLTADRHIHFVDGSGLGYWQASKAFKSHAD